MSAYEVNPAKQRLEKLAAERAMHSNKWVMPFAVCAPVMATDAFVAGVGTGEEEMGRSKKFLFLNIPRSQGRTRHRPASIRRNERHPALIFIPSPPPLSSISWQVNRPDRFDFFFRYETFYQASEKIRENSWQFFTNEIRQSRFINTIVWNNRGKSCIAS